MRVHNIGTIASALNTWRAISIHWYPYFSH